MSKHNPILRGHAAALLLSALATGCKAERHALVTDTATSDTASLPEPTPVRRVAFRVAAETEVLDPTVLASVRRGRAIMLHTRDSLPRHVGNRLACTSCGFAAIASLALWFWAARHDTSRLMAASLALIIGGAIGNGIDRIVLGGVADFISLHALGFYWYIFNVADVAIVAGVAGLLYDSFKPESQ